MQTITSPTTGEKIPVRSNIELKPLTHSSFVNGKFVRNAEITTPSGIVMNNRWICVNDGYGMYSINVIRSEYCILQELKSTTISESIGNKKITLRLQRFIDEISPTLAFKKYGKTYRVYLKKVGYKYDLLKVMPYWATTSIGCNKNIKGLCHAHQLVIDIDSIFYVKGIM